MSEYAIRPARQSDVEEITICVARAYEHHTERIGKTPGPILDDYSKIVGKNQAFVAISSNQLVGVVVLIERAGGILLDNIAVHPEFQNRGLGRKLIEFSETKAREQGYIHLALYTNVLMTENITLYQKLGYLETKRLTEKGFNRVYMSKSFV